MRRTHKRQLTLPMPNTWGGKRKGAGRKRKAPRPRVIHRKRPFLAARFPVFVTVRLVHGLESLRRRVQFGAVERSLRRAQGRFGLRINHFTVQSNHLHLIVESPDRVALSRAMKGLNVRVAKAL